MHEIDEAMLREHRKKMVEPHPRQEAIDQNGAALLYRTSSLSQDEQDLLRAAALTSPIYEAYGPEIDQALAKTGRMVDQVVPR